MVSILPKINLGGALGKLIKKKKKASVKNIPTGKISGPYESWDPSKSIEVEGKKGKATRVKISKGYKRRKKLKEKVHNVAKRTLPFVSGALGGMVGGIGGALTGATLGGLISESEKAQKFVTSYAKDPGKTGREIGKIIDEPSKVGGILDTFKTAGIIGGTALGGGALIYGGKKIYDWWKGRKTKQPALSPSPVSPSQSGVLVTEVAPLPATTTPQTSAMTEEKEAVPSSEVGQIPKINNIVQIANYIN